MALALLSILLLLFMLRVLGQIIVAVASPRWLPPMKDWYSGLIKYPVLLPTQIAIILLMIFMVRQVVHGTRNTTLAYGIFAFATIYALSMVVRFVILRRNHPEYRWYEGGMIPIMFHWVLAAFLFTYAAARL